MEAENKRITLDAFRTMPDIVDPMPVARLLGISDRSVYRLCQNGTFKAVKCGKLWRINRDSVLSYIGVIACNRCQVRPSYVRRNNGRTQSN